MRRKVNTSAVTDWSGFDLFGGGIKKVQRLKGSGETTGTRRYFDVTIESVNINNSAIRLTKYSPITSIGGTGATNFYRAELINSTTVRIHDIQVNDRTMAYDIEVIEFAKVKSKQTGDFLIDSASGSKTLSINAVDASKSLIFYTLTSSISGFTNTSTYNSTVPTFTVEFQNDSSLKFGYPAGGSYPSNIYHYEVLEFE